MRFYLPALTRAKFTMAFVLPEETFRVTGPVTLTFSINGRILDRVRYEKPGEEQYTHQVPPEFLKPQAINIVGVEPDKVAAPHPGRSCPSYSSAPGSRSRIAGPFHSLRRRIYGCSRTGPGRASAGRGLPGVARPLRHGSGTTEHLRLPPGCRPPGLYQRLPGVRRGGHWYSPGPPISLAALTQTPVTSSYSGLLFHPVLYPVFLQRHGPGGKPGRGHLPPGPGGSLLPRARRPPHYLELLREPLRRDGDAVPFRVRVRTALRRIHGPLCVSGCFGMADVSLWKA